MEKRQTVEIFIEKWGCDFPNYPLTLADLKKPHAFMGALCHVFDRLGIDKNIILQAPPEESNNKHFIYYWDLIPVINVTRIINYLVSKMQHNGTKVTIIHFLQPTTTTSHSILCLLVNLMVFNEACMTDIAPYEQELFSKREEVKTLEDRKNRLLEMLNEQAEEKGRRAERLEKLDTEIKHFEEELKHEKEAHEEERKKLDVILNEDKQTEILLEKKKTLRDCLIAEVENKRAQRVYDADDIKAQVEQAAQNNQEAEQKLSSLKATLMNKENRLKNLHAIKPHMDTGSNLLYEIIKLSESMKDNDSNDLESDSQDGELEVYKTEASELEAQLADLRAARAEKAKKRQENLARMQQENMLAKTNLQEAEEKKRKNVESAKKITQRIQEIKHLTTKYEEEKAEGMEELARIKNDFSSSLKSIEDLLIKKTLEAKKRIEDKIRNRNEIY
ncbi:unnamed protein product [Parnassius apollo]|uniref:(apollo) hypothetical protein n=1 Tax=Parnassius apollo TaxID=110799 RepID=A0A8S3WXJ0_PARAO|nr:unnamed protein product [Parnassius apollo]